MINLNLTGDTYHKTVKLVFVHLPHQPDPQSNLPLWPEGEVKVSFHIHFELNEVGSINSPNIPSLDSDKLNSEELIKSGIKCVLQTYTEISEPNLQEIHEDVTWIYETVEKQWLVCSKL